MGLAYFIALNHSNHGFDPFVNGKAVAREANRISKIASSLGLKTLDHYLSMAGDEAAATALEFDIGDDVPHPPEQWFGADEGLAWILRLRAHIQSDAKALKSTDAVLADLADYERVLSQAKLIGAKWHFSIDF